MEAIIDMYCVCVGARDSRCKHIVAAMYSLEDLLKSRGKDSVTSGPCQWNRKPKPDTTSCEVKDLCSKDMPDNNTKEQDVIDSECGILERKLISHMSTNKHSNAESFSNSLQFTDEERSKVNVATKKQWQFKQWFIHKTGFVTASKVKSVNIRQISVEKHKTDVSFLVKSLVSDKATQPNRQVPKDPKNSTDWGLKHESSAQKGQKNHHFSFLLKRLYHFQRKAFPWSKSGHNHL